LSKKKEIFFLIRAINMKPDRDPDQLHKSRPKISQNQKSWFLK